MKANRQMMLSPTEKDGDGVQEAPERACKARRVKKNIGRMPRRDPQKVRKKRACVSTAKTEQNHEPKETSE